MDYEVAYKRLVQNIKESRTHHEDIRDLLQRTGGDDFPYRNAISTLDFLLETENRANKLPLMRNLGDVISQCMAELPKEGYEGLRYDARKVITNIGYTPPELILDRWFDWSRALEFHLKDADQDMAGRIRAIMRNKGAEENK